MLKCNNVPENLVAPRKPGLGVSRNQHILPVNVVPPEFSSRGQFRGVAKPALLCHKGREREMGAFLSKDLLTNESGEHWVPLSDLVNS